MARPARCIPVTLGEAWLASDVCWHPAPKTVSASDATTVAHT